MTRIQINLDLLSQVSTTLHKSHDNSYGRGDAQYRVSTDVLSNPICIEAHARNISAHSTALIAQDSDIRGTVSFGPGCIIHPRATIHVLSPNAEIKFGKDCVVEEGAKIIHSYASHLLCS